MKKLKSKNYDRLEQEVVEWLIRLTTGEASPDEFAEFAKWQARSPAHGLAYRKISALWENLGNPLIEWNRQQGQATLGDVGQQYQNPNNEPEADTKTRKRKTGLISAATTISLTMIFLASLFPDYLRYPLVDYRTHIGERRDVVLADGSVIRLNTNTAINTNYTDQERKVELLQGEAEFEVSHDGQRPFIVTTAAINTQAVGTKFLVRYQGNQGVVTLLEGKIKVSASLGLEKSSSEVTLNRGEQITFNGNRINSPKHIDIAGVDEWKNGRLLMSFVTLGQVVAEINRYRRGKVVLINNQLAQREINVAIDINQINAWLDALQETLPLNAHRAGPIVFLMART